MATIESVELLRRQYMQLVEPHLLALPKPDLLKLPQTQASIYDKMFDNRKLKFAPPIRYQFRVLKIIMLALEKAIDDSEEDVCCLLACI